MYLNDEKEMQEIDALFNFYLEHKLDEAIEKVEYEKKYIAALCEKWKG